MPKRRRKKERPADAPLLSATARLARSLSGPLAGGSGPAVARLFDRLLAALFLVAWISLGAQIDVLLGSRGLLPAAPYVEALQSQGASFFQAPTIFTWIGASDRALHAGVAAGIALAVIALAGAAPRLCFGLGTALYLGFAVVSRTFLSFQWDNLLIECGLLATILPHDRRAPWAHFLLRVLLFKLYWESGVAKWQSPLHDWHDGSAMTFYYETAPIPARLAWFAHHLPAWWHAFEGWFTLFFELCLTLAIFATRRLRLAALAVFTLFQIVDIVTANYGFFCYLALALHVFLLDDRDVRAARARLERRWPWIRALRVRGRFIDLRVHRAFARLHVSNPMVRRVIAGAAVTAYLSISTMEGMIHFSGSRALTSALAPIREKWAPFRAVNAYHLFAAITRERIEPEVQTFDGGTWRAHDLRHKPGDPSLAPHLVAPHQPRLDFQLWFYGLSYRRGTPAYVGELLDRVCHDPAVVEPLFREKLPERPASARIAFFRYHFTTPAERRATGAWWRREPLSTMQPVPCHR